MSWVPFQANEEPSISTHLVPCPADKAPVVQQRVVESNVRPAQNITHHWDISFGNRDVYRMNREPVSGRRIRHARAAEGEFAPMHFVGKSSTVHLMIRGLTFLSHFSFSLGKPVYKYEYGVEAQGRHTACTLHKISVPAAFGSPYLSPASSSHRK